MSTKSLSLKHLFFKLLETKKKTYLQNSIYNNTEKLT